MEETRSTKNPSSYNKRLSHTFHQKTTSSDTQRTKPFSNKGIRGNVNYHISNDDARGARGSFTLSEFPVLNVSGPQSRWHQSAYFQPKESERFCLHETIQAHKCVSCPRLPPTKRLALQSRPVTGLLQFANTPVAQTIPTSKLQRNIATNDLPSFWSQHSAQSLRNSNKLGSTDTKRGGYSNTSLFRRFLRGSPGPSGPASARPNTIRSPTLPGVADELSKICHNSVQKPRIFRRSMESMDKREIIATRKDHKNKRKGAESVTQTLIEVESTSKPGRSSKLRQFCSTKGQTSLSGHTNVSKQKTKRRLCQCSFTYRSKGGPKVVATKLSSGLSDSLPATVTFPDHRRVGCSLGGSTRWIRTIRTMDRPRATAPLQSKGDARNTKGHRRPRSKHVQVDRSSSVRQQDCCSLFEKRRGDQVYFIAKTHERDFSNPPPAPNQPENPTYSGKIQLPRRPSFSSSAPSGVASLTPVYGENIQKIRSSSDRSICIRTGKSCDQLCISGSERHSSDVPRCVFPKLDLPTSLGVSSTLPSAQGTSSPQLGVGCLSNSSPEVGESLLESRPKSPCISTSIHNPETSFTPDRYGDRPPTTKSPGNDVRSLAMWGWSQTLVEWTEAQLQLLKSSWRPSTKKTYQVAWNRWLTWTKKHKLNPFQPTGEVLARFLADLSLRESLAYKTILLHKSVVCTLSNPDESAKLSSHVLVTHILKSIALKNPVAQKPVVWNVDKLAEYMGSYSVDANNVFATCRHTATLLLLCSGRRVHDLTLLAVDSKHLSESNDCLILWPIFGSKTDTANYRQSGWRLSPNPTNENLDPVLWVRRTIAILKDKRQSGCLDNLFLNFRGKSRVASRTVIAGWVKSLLIEAGVSASPGSLRSAVASRNWVNNYSLDEILSRGNWRSQNTFTRFYCREVMPCMQTSSSCNVSRTFNPIN